MSADARTRPIHATTAAARRALRALSNELNDEPGLVHALDSRERDGFGDYMDRVARHLMRAARADTPREHRDDPPDLVPDPAAGEVPDDARDAARWRALRALMEGAVGASLGVNARALVYEAVDPARRVGLAWYPNTPVGFYDVEGSSLDAIGDYAVTWQAEGTGRG